MGLLYKKQGKLNISAKFFKQILELEEAVKVEVEDSMQQLSPLDPKFPRVYDKFKDISRDVGSTLINLCSMYSSMGKHEIALRYAQHANKVLEKVFLDEVKTLKGEQLKTEYFLNFVQVISTSYHNTGVEFEHLLDFSQTMKFYLLAFSLANKYLGSKHPLTSLF